MLLAHIGLSIPRVQAMLAANQPLPAAIQGTFLLDTGASCTCVDEAFIQQLGLQPTGVAPIKTPSTGAGLHHCNQYDISMVIAGSTGQAFIVEALPVIGTHLRSQGIDGLIGRDVLDKCTLIYNGTANMFTLAY